MMEITRRHLLGSMAKGAATVLAAGGVSSVALADGSLAEEKQEASQTAIAMLYDATRCVGCQTCVSVCAQANNLTPDTRLDPLHQPPRDLNDTTRSVIKLYKPADGTPYSYIKQQCMHCVSPACVAACLFGALKKETGTGIVTWNPSLCVGCRYCEIVCPYHIPKFQWHGINPRIVKCEFSKERLVHGGDPACTSVCPTHALVFGRRTSLLDEAKLRIKNCPGKYYQDRVFGEREGGGTQVLYLTKAPFGKLGLPKMGDESIPGKYLKWQKQMYSYLLFPAALYAVIVSAARRNWNRHEKHLKEEEKATGLRTQL
jgi:Fe-S-cluster-containing dehydrogenase component